MLAAILRPGPLPAQVNEPPDVPGIVLSARQPWSMLDGVKRPLREGRRRRTSAASCFGGQTDGSLWAIGEAGAVRIHGCGVKFRDLLRVRARATTLARHNTRQNDYRIAAPPVHLART